MAKHRGPKSKIVNESEAKRWLIEEGQTYEWMIETYLSKYNVETSKSMWSRKYALWTGEHRTIPRGALMPWTVKEEHRTHFFPHMLRMVDRSRRGVATDRDEGRVAAFLENLADRHAVIHYDPDTEQGWFLVPREPWDTDIIRDPKMMRNPAARSTQH